MVITHFGKDLKLIDYQISNLNQDYIRKMEGNKHLYNYCLLDKFRLVINNG